MKFNPNPIAPTCTCLSLITIVRLASQNKSWNEAFALAETANGCGWSIKCPTPETGIHYPDDFKFLNLN